LQHSSAATSPIDSLLVFDLDQAGKPFGVALSSKQNVEECVVDYLVTYGQAPVTRVENELLSNRQREIFDLIVVGQSNKEIARYLGLGEGTVKIHVAKLFRKLGVRHRSAVALAGAKLGLRPSPMFSWQALGTH
jgi:DNA-binding CsgD family transcriptional regulator